MAMPGSLMPVIFSASGQGCAAWKSRFSAGDPAFIAGRSCLGLQLRLHSQFIDLRLFLEFRLAWSMSKMIRDLVAKNRSYRRFDESAAVSEDRLRAWVDLAVCRRQAPNLQPLKISTFQPTGAQRGDF
jgi:hypothetical protein